MMDQVVGAVPADRIERRRHGDREMGRTVIGADAAQDLLLVRPPETVVVVVQHPHRAVVGDRSRIAEIDLVQVAGRQACDLFRKGGGRRVGEIVEGRIKVQLVELLGDRVDDFLAPVARVHAPQAADAVDQLVALAVADHGAVGADDHGARAVLFQGIQVGEGLDQMGICRQHRVGGHVQIKFHRFSRPPCSLGVEVKAVPGRCRRPGRGRRPEAPRPVRRRRAPGHRGRR